MTTHNHIARRRRRGAVGAAAVLVSLAAAAGCSGEADGATGTSLSLLYPTGNPGLEETMETVLGADFTERTGIEVELQSGAVTYGDVDQRILADQAGGDLPDMALIGYNSVQPYAAAGIVQPLDEALDAAGVPLDELYPAYTELGQVDGVTYAVPQVATYLNLYYNVDAFEQAGLDPNDPPETFSELRDAAAAVVDSGAARTGVVWRLDSTASWPFQNFVLAAGARLVDESGQPDFDTPESRKVLEYWAELEQAGLAGGGSGEEVAQQFLQGDAAMTINSSSFMATWKDTAAFDFRVARTPIPDGGSAQFLAFGTAAVVFTDDPAEQEAAAEVIAALIGQDGQKFQIDNSGYLPVNETAVESGSLKASIGDDPERATMASWAEDVVAWRQLDTSNAQEAWTALDERVAAALSGSQPPAEALAQAQQTALGIMR